MKRKIGMVSTAAFVAVLLGGIVIVDGPQTPRLYGDERKPECNFSPAEAFASGMPQPPRCNPPLRMAN